MAAEDSQAPQRDPTPDDARVTAAPDDGGASDVVGSRAHIRTTLERARQAIRSARELTANSQSLLTRAASLVGASGRAVQDSVALRAQLRASVTAYVCHLRGDGVPAERMLVLVKSAVREATPPELDVWEACELMEDVVRWSVEAYYDAA
jgi:hypothetical protein